jgi:ribosomal protein S18 acetylase RimI-like enzyme
MAVRLREFRLEDHEEAYALWAGTEGIGLSEADSRENIAAFLERNPGLSYVAIGESGRLVGAVLCGTDGRRGYLHHLAVVKAHRNEGIGNGLVHRSLASLRERGIAKCHIFVISDNEEGKRFWERIGWEERTSLIIMSRDLSS